MESFQNGDHYRVNKNWDKRLHMPYDYKNKGLINHIMSHKLWNTKNELLKYLLNHVENSLIYVMETADILNNFYNYNWKNR